MGRELSKALFYAHKGHGSLSLGMSIARTFYDTVGQPHKAPGMTLRGRTHLCIKAINKIIGVGILFQTSRLLANPAAVKDNFLAVTGVRGLLVPPQTKGNSLDMGYRPAGCQE